MPSSIEAITLVIISSLFVIVIYSSVAVKFNAFGQYDSYEHCVYKGQYPPVDDLSWSSNCCWYKNTDTGVLAKATPPIMVCQICKGVGFQKQCSPANQRVIAIRPAGPQQPPPASPPPPGSTLGPPPSTLSQQQQPPTTTLCPNGSTPDANGNCPSSNTIQQIAPLTSTPSNNTTPSSGLLNGRIPTTNTLNAPITTTGGNTSNPSNNNTTGGSLNTIRGASSATRSLINGNSPAASGPQPPLPPYSTPVNSSSAAMKAIRGVYSPTGGCDRSRTDKCIPCDPGIGSPYCVPSSEWPAGPYCIPGVISTHCIPTTPSKNKIGAIGPPANILSSQSGNTGNTGNTEQQQPTQQQQQQPTAAICPDGSQPDANGKCPSTSGTTTSHPPLSPLTSTKNQGGPSNTNNNNSNNAGTNPIKHCSKTNAGGPHCHKAG
jgi:hypothetical protein